MRILVVSAHYPPNFVSGGTLQPQRIAQELARRGHEVGVYAGWFGEGRPALESWTEGDGPVTIRWVVTTPWTDWSSDANFDNPAVGDDFGRHLDKFRPDVVHFHSLQSLGAGVVEAATARGIPTVVTMHDFWWVCGRQFLVDRSFRPCSLIVEAGICECQRGRGWLDKRNARLARAVEDVDLVLAPSATAAAVLAANGIDPARLGVDENGVPGDRPAGGPAPAAAHGSDLRLVYAGGPDPMKGAAVLAGAVRLLEGETGWQLTVYGAEQAFAGLPVEVRPPFPPGDLDRVLDAADALLVPSVMRESHSLLTREALVRGTPVVCTDSLGPEEVVRHDVNGIVVPAGDAEALAGAVRRLAREPGLLERLRSASTDVTVRSLADQVDGLERRYEGLHVRRPQDRTATPPAVQRVLFVTGIEGAPLRYRVRLPAEGLGLLGVASTVFGYRDPGVDADAGRADVVVFYRVPATDQVLSLIAGLRARGTPVFFDVDDLIFDPGVASDIPALRILPPAEAAHWLEGVQRYRTTLEACDAFIGSTPALCRRVAELTGMPTERFDNGVGVALARLSDAALSEPRRSGPVRIGYLSGTDTHEEDWTYLEPAVAAVLERHPDVELWLGGRVTASAALDPFGRRVHRLPFTPWIKLPSLLRDLDVNLAPLAPDNAFNEAKSAIKWLEAGLVATPSIVSPTEPFQDAVDDNVNGLLATDLDGWAAALDRLIADGPTRARLGHRARRDALLRWSPHLQGRRYLEILARGQEHRAGIRPRSEWKTVVLDEPAFDRPAPVEPYQPDEWRRWERRRRLEPVHPRRLASAARTTAARARARLTRSSG